MTTPSSKNTDQVLPPLGIMIGLDAFDVSDPTPLLSNDFLVADKAGETFSYTAEVTNSGTMDLTNVVVTNASGVVLGTVADLTPGDSASFTGQIQVKQADIDKGQPLVVAAKAHDEQTDTVGASLTLPVLQLPSLSLVQTVDTVAYDPRHAGTVDHALQNVAYTVSVTNTGNETLTGLKTDDGHSVEKLNVGQTWTYTVSHQVTQAEVDNSQTVGKTVTVSDDQGDKQSVTATTPVVKDPEASILLVNSDQTSVNHVGQVINFTAIEANTGNVTLDVTAIDKLNGVWTTLGTDTLVPGQAKFLHFSYTVTQADLDSHLSIDALVEAKAASAPFGDNSWKNTSVTVDHHTTVSTGAISLGLNTPSQPSFAANTSDPLGLNALMAQVRADMQDAAAQIKAATAYVNSLPPLPSLPWQQPTTTSGSVGITDLQAALSQLQTLGGLHS